MVALKTHIAKIALAFLIITGCYADSKEAESTRYRLFTTNNIWNFIQLDTQTGRIWQVQYSIQDNHSGGTIINSENLAKHKKAIVGRFTLYPTNNMWNFILLDQVDGDTYQVQWSFEAKNRFVTPINIMK